MKTSRTPFPFIEAKVAVPVVAFLIAVVVVGLTGFRKSVGLPAASDLPHLLYQPRKPLDTSGLSLVLGSIEPWKPGATLDEVSNVWRRVGYRNIERIDQRLALPDEPAESKISLLLNQTALWNFEGEPRRAYEVLKQARAKVESDNSLAQDWLYTLIYYQGLTALRRGETDNCIMCRGESSCILPIAPTAIHTNRTGSSLAIQHFTDYLHRFPDDLEVRWLLNLAHMTLGEYPDRVDPQFRIALDHFRRSEFDIGKFRDIGHLVGLNRFNQSGGAIMEDLDNDGLLDILVSSIDPTEHLAVYRNKGDGTFEDRSESAGVTNQLGGLYCVQTDYNNDGRIDIFIPRGAWLPYPIRPTLLRNDGHLIFTDVTAETGLLDPVNSNSASWADYDNDGWLDLFICCENQPNRLYHNRGNGTFEEVATRSGVKGGGQLFCKGSAWLDFDNDDYPDLFLNYLIGRAHLYHNNRNGTFTDVSSSMGITGPYRGFPCWAWDYDNDGWLDVFATSYDHTLADIVNGLLGQSTTRHYNKLFHNQKGQGFEDRTRETGLDMAFATMGSNYGDFDNDGFLDMYLGTGDPNLATLVPNRMFKNVAGRRFAEITSSSGTGHLQKGHGVACGDWDRNGDLDIFIEMGGPVNGDKYHNILFQNPGQGNHWLTVKLVGQRTNRPAIGARIKVVTSGQQPLTVHRHVSSGSSFGANPLQQTIGLAQADRVAVLEVHWPASGTTQVFHDIGANQAIEVTEFATNYQPLNWKRVSW
jgi:FG-GAP-like repeat/ASPIC and UnbV